MKFRDLKASEIDVRVGQVGEGYCTLLLYKDARVDMDILDETVGALNWQRSHSRENANCQVSIYDAEKKEWVTKEDTGTESNTEAEKGLASDSFKRACVNWGIGRELYTAPTIRVNCKTSKNDKGKFIIKELSNFTVKKISIEDKVIKGLKITAWDKENRTEIVAFEWGEEKKESRTTNDNENKADKNDKPLTLVEAENLLMPLGNGQSIQMNKLSIGQLEKVMNNDNPEYAKQKEAAILILENKANGNQG